MNHALHNPAIYYPLLAAGYTLIAVLVGRWLGYHQGFNDGIEYKEPVINTRSRVSKYCQTVKAKWLNQMQAAAYEQER